VGLDFLTLPQAFLLTKSAPLPKAFLPTKSAAIYFLTTGTSV
jgi:hypothetical protein